MVYENSLAAANTTPATTASTRSPLRNSRRTTTSTPTHGLLSRALPCFLRTSSMELLTPLLLWRTGRVRVRADRGPWRGRRAGARGWGNNS